MTRAKDSKLLAGGGYPNSVYTVTAAAAGRGADNYVTFETDYGPARINYWQGVDVTVNARLKGSLTLQAGTTTGDRKSTRLNSSHDQISYADFCLKKKQDGTRRTEQA